ncbi:MULTISPECIES: daptide-type RiPP biosynthesis methyltransferase [Streptomyces]|uniref:Class I SAM-dependent methyltransferase n=1 Tax=Streptomyces koelreuteriae TaxID=2838015 RepID=A0ABX8FSQ2_9ACTN|nr:MULTISPECIES: daptide-type RiPP biosynthesis methyltransferase [Streptomyces]QWB24173.1 class I SAM-dependent methyltransferase [Streptomyces koelreuteriae]UUA07163.1 class I SAM-dependent methyltransferase [Streptomyces koelreuteriae]UUA14792.1 class I SAM-dependent methyltransferase [Streptomyces sp. CRCS-T-1]
MPVATTVGETTTVHETTRARETAATDGSVTVRETSAADGSTSGREAGKGNGSTSGHETATGDRPATRYEAATAHASTLAARRIAALGDRARVCGLYDALGAPLYHDLATYDDPETRALLTAVRTTPGPVLDLAAGSGRFTLPLLAIGREVTALDLSTDMLALLRTALDRAPASMRERCTVVRGDMSRFALGQRFPRILLGTTSLSLLDEDGRAGLYRGVLAHLAEGGRFLLTVLERGDCDAPDETAVRVTGAGGTVYELYEHWPAGADSRTVTLLPADPPRGDSPVTVCTDRVAVLDLPRLEEELAASGLTITSRQLLSPPGERHRVTLLTTEASR